MSTAGQPSIACLRERPRARRRRACRPSRRHRTSHLSQQSPKKGTADVPASERITRGTSVRRSGGTHRSTHPGAVSNLIRVPTGRQPPQHDVSHVSGKGTPGSDERRVERAGPATDRIHHRRSRAADQPGADQPNVDVRDAPRLGEPVFAAAHCQSGWLGAAQSERVHRYLDGWRHPRGSDDRARYARRPVSFCLRAISVTAF